jgi:cell division protein FtsW
LNKVVEIYQNLRGDKAIWLIMALLSLLSVLVVYSAAGSMAYSLRGGNTEYYLIQQLIFLISGLGITYVAYKIDYTKYARLAPYLLLIAIPLLIYTLAFGTEINQARRWITIPWIDKTIQTSDFAKIALILFIARSLAVKQDYIKDFKQAFLPIIMPVVLICALIAPADLSTAALLFATSMIMMFVGRISMKYVFLLMLLGAGVGAMIFVIGLQFPEYIRVETWMSRINDFLAMNDGDYQVQQAKIAIAEGGLFGVGPGNSLQSNHVPYAYADFIYAIICAEYGLIGGLMVLGLYLWLLIRCINIVTKSPRAFGGILAMGLCLNLVLQAFANIAVSVQLVPATGLTLPLISMGGTSLLFTCASFGIILSVSRTAEMAEEERMELQKLEANNESDN